MRNMGTWRSDAKGVTRAETRQGFEYRGGAHAPRQLAPHSRNDWGGYSKMNSSPSAETARSPRFLPGVTVLGDRMIRSHLPAMLAYSVAIGASRNSVSRLGSILKRARLITDGREWRENSQIMRVTDMGALALAEWDWSLSRKIFTQPYGVEV
jgi:hypothetical protein